MKKMLAHATVLGVILYANTACMSTQPGYGGAISSQIGMVQNYSSNAENIELQALPMMV